MRVFRERNFRQPPNNSLKPTRLAGENASVPGLLSCPRMKERSLSRRAA
jgi:hypothetical protein